MADPLSITASVLAIVTAAIRSTTSLANAVNRFKGRDKTLSRLQNQLKELGDILQTLREIIGTETSALTLLEAPVSRCSELCTEFEKTMKIFDGKSKVGIRDWSKLEFMRGDINDFMDTLAGYQSTISLGIGTINLRTSKVTQKVLEEYNEIIMDTTYALNIHLQRIDEKMAQLTAKNTQITGIHGIETDLKDERAVTEQCLRICEDAKSYLGSLTDSGGFLKQQSSPMASAEDSDQFEAQVLMGKTLEQNRDNLSETIGRLQERLKSLKRDGTPEDQHEEARLQEELKNLKQCLEVCKVASNVVANQKIYRIGELVADTDSDQVVITTLADLFDVKKATSTNRSAQWIGSFTDETARQLSSDRYHSRFGTMAVGETSFNTQFSTAESQKDSNTVQNEAKSDSHLPTGGAVPRRPISNEIRKRGSEAGSEKGKTLGNDKA